MIATMSETFSYGIPFPENKNAISSLSECIFRHLNRHAGEKPLLRLRVNAHLEGGQIRLPFFASHLQIGKSRCV